METMPPLFQIWLDPDCGRMVGNPGRKIPLLGERNSWPLGCTDSPPAFVVIMLKLPCVAFWTTTQFTDPDIFIKLNRLPLPLVPPAALMNNEPPFVCITPFIVPSLPSNAITGGL